MSETPVFKQSGLYKTSMRLRQLGRFALFLCLPVVAVLFSFPRDGRVVHPPTWWGYLFLLFVAICIAGIWGDVLVAAFMKCDRCRRRPTLVWSRKYRQRMSEWLAIREFFLPSEIRSGAFTCEHCGARFRLA